MNMYLLCNQLGFYDHYCRFTIADSWIQSNIFRHFTWWKVINDDSIRDYLFVIFKLEGTVKEHCLKGSKLEIGRIGLKKPWEYCRASVWSNLTTITNYPWNKPSTFWNKSLRHLNFSFVPARKRDHNFSIEACVNIYKIFFVILLFVRLTVKRENGTR